MVLAYHVPYWCIHPCIQKCYWVHYHSLIQIIYPFVNIYLLYCAFYWPNYLVGPLNIQTSWKYPCRIYSYLNHYSYFPTHLGSYLPMSVLVISPLIQSKHVGLYCCSCSPQLQVICQAIHAEEGMVCPTFWTLPTHTTGNFIVMVYLWSHL